MQLVAGEDQEALLVRRDALIVLIKSINFLNCVGGLYVYWDRLARQNLQKK